jgi:pimeloyl-ACP methyl ester carboxylesterase
MQVHDGGEGRPLVLLHGFPLSSAIFEPIRPVVERAGRLVTPDLRGFGGSDAPEASYAMADLAEDVIRVVDQLGIGRFVLGGHSMGGYVAFRIAERHRDRMVGLVLMDTRATVDTPQAIVKRRAAISKILAGGRNALLDELLPSIIGPSALEREPEILPRVRAMAETVPDHVLIGCLEGMIARPDSGDLLEELDIPALVMVGAEDELLPATEARELADALPQGRLKVVAGAGHTPSLEQPDETGDVLAVFLRELS